MKQLFDSACCPERIAAWNDRSIDADGGCVVYWMAHAQRAERNLAFDAAIAAANELQLPLLVVLDLDIDEPERDLRHLRIQLSALAQIHDTVRARGAGWAVRPPDAAGVLGDDLVALGAALVVTDEDAMPHARAARRAVAERLDVPLVSVDADVIIPASMLDRREHAARTVRPKIHRMLERYVGELGSCDQPVARRWSAAISPDVSLDQAVPDAVWCASMLERARRAGVPDEAGKVTCDAGRAAALTRLGAFVDRGLARYDERRNQPHLDGTSGLSVALRYGHLSVHEIVAAARASEARSAGVDVFIEELVVRRELAWNHVLHTPDCRSFDALPDWARATLEQHAADPRPALHDEAEMRAARTRDPLWNAAQRQLLQTGLMHGYLRMYWAKQILTWTQHPRDAFEVALRMHDRYAIDGCNPNSIVGVAWAIGGVHDRGWPERDVFGKVRSMTYASTSRKFDAAAYIARWGGATPIPRQLSLDGAMS